MSEVSISKINIKIGKKEVELTPDEAKELQEILNETFGKKERVYIPSPYPVVQPVYRPYRYWEVTYGNGTGTVTYSATNHAG